MKRFVIPIILWTYLISAVLARESWGVVYDKVIRAFDLSPNQSWLLPIGLNLLATALAMSQVIPFVTSLHKRLRVTPSKHVASSLCIAAACLCTAAVVLEIVRWRDVMAGTTAAQEKYAFSAGVIDHGCYSNAVLGVVIELPENWYPMTLNAIRWAKQSGSAALAGEDPRRTDQTAAPLAGAYPLFAVQRYPDAHPGYNPSLALNAYDKRAFAAKGIATLESYAEGFAQLAEPFHVLSGPTKKLLGNDVAYYLQIEARLEEATIQQHVYVLETMELYLVLAASAIDAKDLLVMQNAVSTLRIKPPAKAE